MLLELGAAPLGLGTLGLGLGNRLEVNLVF